MTTLTPEECVRVVDGIEKYLASLLHASDFLAMCRPDAGADQFDTIMEAYSTFQPGYMFESAIDSGLFIKMLKPGLGRMIGNEAEKLGEPNISWPEDNSVRA